MENGRVNCHIPVLGISDEALLVSSCGWPADHMESHFFAFAWRLTKVSSHISATCRVMDSRGSVIEQREGLEATARFASSDVQCGVIVAVER